MTEEKSEPTVTIDGEEIPLFRAREAALAFPPAHPRPAQPPVHAVHIWAESPQTLH